MQWPEFAHAIRAATAILGEQEVLVIGSQAIHAAFDEEKLPPAALASMEIDIAALDDPDETKSHILAGAIGEGSPFHDTFGFFVDGVSITTPVAPAGWKSRLIRVQSPAMNGAAALCIEPHDLCVAKLYAGRPKDLDFVRALLDAGLIDGGTLRERSELVDAPASARERVRQWLKTA